MPCKNGRTDCVDLTDREHPCPQRVTAPRQASPRPARCATCGVRYPTRGWACSVCADAAARVEVEA